MEGQLTVKQKAFIDAYLIHHNATEAARQAGYRGNSNTLRVVGHENLTKPAIQEAIQAKQQAVQRRTAITQNMAIENLYSIATTAENDVHRIQAWRTIADIQGWIVRKAELKSESTTVTLTLEEARAIMAARGIGRPDVADSQLDLRAPLALERVEEDPD